MSHKIALIGAGNVAYSLAPAIAAAPGFGLVQIVARTASSAQALAADIPGCSGDTVDRLTDSADIYILAVTDTALTRLAAELTPRPEAFWFHTSGSVPAVVLARLSPHYGVVYPLQTFTRGRRLDMRRVPIFIEGSDSEATEMALKLANAISDTVHPADSAARKRMHIAAVFGCNFVTHMLDIADRQLRADGLDISVLQPLIDETMRKCAEIGPHSAQTGPARRGDSGIIRAHEEMLSEELRPLYHLISQSIMKEYEQN